MTVPVLWFVAAVGNNMVVRESERVWTCLGRDSKNNGLALSELYPALQGRVWNYQQSPENLYSLTNADRTGTQQFRFKDNPHIVHVSNYLHLWPDS